MSVNVCVICMSTCVRSVCVNVCECMSMHMCDVCLCELGVYVSVCECV